MKILAIDVAVRDCQVGLRMSNSSQEHFDFKYTETQREQTEILLPMIESLLKQNDLLPASLDMIAVTRGPGSFTGVRIGLAVARALGMSLNIPVLGFSTLEMILMERLLRQSLHPQGNLGEPEHSLAVIDTKRDDYYGLSYNMLIERLPARIFSIEEVDSWRGTIIRDSLPPIEFITQLAAKILQEDYKNYPATPLYIRQAEIHIKS